MAAAITFWARAVKLLRGAEGRHGKKTFPGTIIFLRMPGGGDAVVRCEWGKAGCFDDVDVAIAWHPVGVNKVSEETPAGHGFQNLSLYGKPPMLPPARKWAGAPLTRPS